MQLAKNINIPDIFTLSPNILCKLLFWALYKLLFLKLPKRLKFRLTLQKEVKNISFVSSKFL